MEMRSVSRGEELCLEELVELFFSSSSRFSFVRNTRLEGSAIDARKVRSVWRSTIRKVAPSASVLGERLLASKLALVGGSGG